MIKHFLFLVFLFLSKLLPAQTITEDDILSLLKDSADDNNSSSLIISANAGNGVFSKKNNSLNADQETLNKIFYSINVDYYHKSGFGLSINSSFIPEAGSLNFYQAGITPSYFYQNKNIYTGISYTHFFAGKNSAIAANPFENEFSGSFKWLKTWIRPGFQLQYSNGKSQDIYDSSKSLNTSPPRVLRFVDTVNSTIRDFTASFSIDHKFVFEHLFAKNDELSFVSALALNAGSNKTSTVSTANLSITRKKKQPLASTKRSKTGNDNQCFKIQSIALSADFYYSIGKFFIEPQVYTDYYLPATDTKRLSTVFSMGIGVGF